jgi:aspartyl protease family protein
VPIATLNGWQGLALIAFAAALLLTLLFRIPYLGRALRILFSVALLAFGIFLLLRQAPFDPALAGLAGRLGLDDQQVAGDEVRIRMSPDGHFWARAAINGVERRMLIDSGATVTALSERTARLASVHPDTGLLPVVVQTAAGNVRAQTGTIDRLDLGGIQARNLRVVISPALDRIDILGMNFLSLLGSWRVEGSNLILVPRRPRAGSAAGAPRSK